MLVFLSGDDLKNQQKKIHQYYKEETYILEESYILEETYLSKLK